MQYSMKWKAVLLVSTLVVKVSERCWLLGHQLALVPVLQEMRSRDVRSSEKR